MKFLLRLRSFNFLVCIIVGFTSCKKNDSAIPTPSSNKLTGSTWTSSNIEIQQSDGTWKSDNDPDFHFAFTFNTDNTFTVKHTVSDGSSTSTSGSWHFANNNSQIIIADTQYQGAYTITQLTSSTLQWTVLSQGFWGTNSAVRETFGH